MEKLVKCFLSGDGYTRQAQQIGTTNDCGYRRFRQLLVAVRIGALGSPASSQPPLPGTYSYTGSVCDDVVGVVLTVHLASYV